MSYNWDTKRLLEAAYLTAIMTFFAAAGLYVPGLMVFTIFLSAIPLVILTIKAGEKIAILSIAACYILIILLTGEIIVATTTLFSFCFAGLALGYGLKSKWEFNKLFIFSSPPHNCLQSGEISYLRFKDGNSPTEHINSIGLPRKKPFIVILSTKL